MKAIIDFNFLIVNTYVRSLKGEPIFGKIVEIDMSVISTMKIPLESSLEITGPNFEIRTKEHWNDLSNRNYEIFDISKFPQLMILFAQVSKNTEIIDNLLVESFEKENRIFPNISKETIYDSEAE